VSLYHKRVSPGQALDLLHDRFAFIASLAVAYLAANLDDANEASADEKGGLIEAGGRKGPAVQATELAFLRDALTARLKDATSEWLL
jgi:hypothetical protein